MRCLPRSGAHASSLPCKHAHIDCVFNQLLPGSVAVELEETSEPDPREPTPTLKSESRPESRPPPTAPDHISMHPVPPGPVRPSVVAIQSQPSVLMSPSSPPHDSQRPADEATVPSHSSVLAPAGPSSSLHNDNATPPNHGPPPAGGSVTALSRPGGAVRPLLGLRLQPLDRGSASQPSDAPVLPGTTHNETRTRTAAAHPTTAYSGDRPGGGDVGAQDLQAHERGPGDERSARRRLRTLRPLPHGTDGRPLMLPRESLT